ncbi:hypothetical protein PK35_16820 [Tamlana nanhaiensis]|uniref:DUF3592 domain-containing protein n=1 Tax=Neotamlana nanhaiensis TaxID=1382798 RepID=A0A0D7VW25_9FLAO|nr:hypothetical protein [Tamlana nanhaiensis]KJD31051.1 hypothetical protein PK35_16820 [Tamlana nanhaiensis]
MNLAENYIKIKEFISEYYWIAGIPFLIWGLILVVEEKQDIKQNGTETFGMVYGSKSIYKQYSKRNYKYEFYYNGKKYTGTSTAYNSENVENGNFYKVEFSDKNPEHSQMNFDLEYVREIKTNENGKVDTTYVPKDQKLRNKMKERLEKFKIELDTIKN